MNDHLPDFFADRDPGKHFYQVISLHEKEDLNWEEIAQMMPLLPKGWFELAQLQVADRIEFTYEFWKSKLPFMVYEDAHLEERLGDFFQLIEEIGIFATQAKLGGIFEIHMVYSLKNGMGFFQGGPPASEESLNLLTKQFETISFPADYMAFLQIHDGFSKYTDRGIIKTRELVKVYQILQHLLRDEILVQPNGEWINPEHLIPFYESFGLHNYQCFYANWIPKKEMGNIYFSEYDHAISNYLVDFDHEDNFAFSSFLDWLLFYLEDI